MSRRYAVHGVTLGIEGDLALRLPLAPDAPDDIRVHVQSLPTWAADEIDPARSLYAAPDSAVDANLLDVAWVRSGAGIRMRYAEGATFWIAAALDQIWFTYSDPLTPDDAAHFLLEPVMAFVLRCRGTLVLHASAVEFGGHGVVFCGSSSGGKSTVAAACVADGAALLSDDIVALTLRHGQWRAQCGTGPIRVWDEGARALLGRADLAPRFSPTWDKRVVRAELLGGRRATTAARVAFVCVLADRDEDERSPRLEPVTGHEAFAALVPHTAANYLADPAARADEVGQLARLISDVPVFRLISHADASRLDRISPAIRAHLGG